MLNPKKKNPNSNMLKISLPFNTNTMKECEIFRVFFLYELEYIGRFSNLHWCTFKR